MLRFKFLYKDGCSWQNLEFLRATRSHPHIVKNSFHSKQITRIEQEWWYQNEYSQDENHKIYIAYDDKMECPIGYIQYKIESIIHRRCHVNYVVAYQFIDHKYDSKLIRWCVNNISTWNDEMNRIQTMILVDDENRLQNYIRCGFEVDGILRKYVYKNGIFQDVYVLSTLVES